MIPLRVFRVLSPVWFVLAASLVAGGCNDSPTAPSSYAAYSQTDLVVGTGTTAATGNVVTVNYTGWLYDSSKNDNKGLQFETTRGSTTFAFQLGTGSVIPGWDKGVVGMSVGGTRRLVIPPSLAYGAARNSIIPPNSTLIFDIELVSVETVQ